MWEIVADTCWIQVCAVASKLERAIKNMYHVHTHGLLLVDNYLLYVSIAYVCGARTAFRRGQAAILARI